MDIYLFVLIFCGVLGLLVVLYAVHFRYRAQVMGPARLRDALSRTVAGDEEASEEELAYGLSQLFGRLGRGILLDKVLLLLLLALILVFTFTSILPQLALILSALCLLLLSALISLMLLRDTLRYLERHLEQGRSS
ncbi:MAG: hypothetical protein SWK76_07890 [Actinomycetota bacterium]|nr:hypothetical protein [Actinomycetota bacterium]